jgi:hypothetical protein
MVPYDENTGWWPPFAHPVPTPPIPPVTPAPVPGVTETITIESFEAAGISGFSADWNRPIPLAENGAMSPPKSNLVPFGAGPVANWSHPTNPGALAFDAVHRSMLLRFPGAAEQIATAIGNGKTILKVEIILPYRGYEVFPPASYKDPAGLSFLGQDWRNKVPSWHAIAWSVNKPWTSDREIGPTYNASVNGAVYWEKYGASESGQDHSTTAFGPTLLSSSRPEARIDVTSSLTEGEFGSTLAERLRRFSDCGFLVRKWEVYDASFWVSQTGVASGAGYEWTTATGGRALLINSPSLVIHLGDGQAVTVTLPPAPDIQLISEQGTIGAPTAVLPSESEYLELRNQLGRYKPESMDNDTWSRLQQLWSKDNSPPSFPETYSGYRAWVDDLFSYSPRRWSGFDAAELGGLIGVGYREAMPNPLLDHMRLYWWAWLMPDRETSSLVNGYTDKAAAGVYYNQTRDWRGNFSVYRTYTREMGPMNFNHWATAGTLFGGDMLDSPRLINEGTIGLRDFLLNFWSWGQGGSTQESIDHYYYSVTLSTQIPFSIYSPLVEQQVMGESILAKNVGELCCNYHPALKRFTSSATRTGVSYSLYTQDGVSSIMHTILPDGALTDLSSTTIGNNLPVFGYDLPPGKVATLALQKPWSPAWYGPMVENKPLPYQAISSYSNNWKKSFQANNYGVASIDVSSSETLPFVIQWRNQDSEVTTSGSLGMLVGRFGVNRTNLLATSGGIVGMQGGRLACIQHNNRLIVLSSPNSNLAYSGVPGQSTPAQIQSLQTTLGMITLHSGWYLLLDGQPATPPFTATANQRIVIVDGVSFIGIIPLPGTNLGRDVEIEVLTDGVQTPMHANKGTLAESLRINAYNYRGSSVPLSFFNSTTLNRSWGGYAVLTGDHTEYEDAADFDSALASGSLTSSWNNTNGQLSVSWLLGDDTVNCVFVPEQSTTGGNSLLPVRNVNGQSLYLPSDTLRECNLSVIGSRGNYTKNGFTYRKKTNSIGYFLTDPVNNIAEAWNPLTTPGFLSLGLPGGGRIDTYGNVGITRITAYVNDSRVDIDGAIPSPGLATIASIRGMPSDTEVFLNGQPALTVGEETENGYVQFVSLDNEPLPEIEVLLSFRVTNAEGNWENASTWINGDTLGIPTSGDRVMINHPVTLSTTTPELSEFINNETLTIRGWNTKLRASTVTVNSIITHPSQTDTTGTVGVYSDWTPDNRIWIECTNLVLNSAASITANGKGYGVDPILPRRGFGPGGGVSIGAISGQGGTYGGGGGLSSRGLIYGNLISPEDPGSSGAGNSWGFGGLGGGAVKIEATGHITINGRIEADGLSPGHNTAGGGSGGSVSITCSSVSGQGIISANGGTVVGEVQGGGAGSGGRISLRYNTVMQAIQNETQNPTLILRCNQGGRGFNFNGGQGDPGTIYLSDTSFFPTASVRGGVLHVEQPSAITLPSLTIAGGMFGVGGGLSLTVQGNVTTTGRGGIYLQNGSIAIAGDLNLSAGTNDYAVSEIRGSLSVAGNLTSNRVRLIYHGSQDLQVGGNFTILNNAPMTITCVPAAPSRSWGARVKVNGLMKISQGSLIDLSSHPTTDSTPLLEVGSFELESGATIEGTGRGYTLGPAAYSSGNGPAGGKGQFDAVGGGHGGTGGRGTLTYGVENVPVTAGSAGGNSAWGAQAGRGGGSLRLVAVDNVIVNGNVRMDGENTSHHRNGAGAGGGIYIYCRNFSGSGVIQARGGSNLLTDPTGGGGGGGRIAVWSRNRSGWTGSLQFPNSVVGGSSSVPGGNGTLALITIESEPVTINSPIVDQTAIEDSPFNFTIPSTTFTGTNLTYSTNIVNGEWLSFNAATSTFSGTPLNDDVGVVSVTVTASDGESSVSDTFSISVINTNDAPTGSLTITGTPSEGQTLTAVPNISDDDGLGTFSYQWNANGVEILGATANTYQLTQNELNKEITVTVSYTDGRGTAETVTSAPTFPVANVDTVAPVFSSGSTAFVDINVVAGAVVYTAVASDSDFNINQITYSLGGADASDFSINPVTGDVTINAIPDPKIKAIYYITVTATDFAGNSSEQPVIVYVSVITLSSNSIPENTVIGSGVKIGDFVVINPEERWENNLSIEGADASNFSMRNIGELFFVGSSPDFEIKSSYSIIVRYTGIEISYTQPFTIVVIDVNETPELKFPLANQNIEENVPFTYTIPVNTFSDVDIGSVLTYSATRTNGSPLPNWLNFNATTRTFSGTPSSSDIGTISITVTASDGELSDSGTFTITIIDINANPTGNITISGTPVEGQILTAVSTLADEDGIGTLSYQWKANGLEIPGATSIGYLLEQSVVGKIITVTATYTDGKGNPESVTSSPTTPIESLDTEPPVFSSGGAVEVDQGVAPGTVVYTAVASDRDQITYGLSGPDLEFFTINPNTGSVSINFSPDYNIKPEYFITIVATDETGNSSEQTVTLTVIVPEQPITPPIDGEGDGGDGVVIEPKPVVPTPGTQTKLPLPPFLRIYGENIQIFYPTSEVIKTGNVVSPLDDKKNINIKVNISIPESLYNELLNEGSPFVEIIDTTEETGNGQ